MIIGIFCATKLKGIAGKKEVSEQFKRGKDFATSMSSTFIHFVEDRQIGRRQSGYMKVYNAISEGRIDALWIASIETIAEDETDLTFFLSNLHENKCSLYINGKRARYTERSFFEKTSRVLSVNPANFPMYMTEQQKGRIRKINTGTKLLPNVYGYTYHYSKKGVTIKINPTEAKNIMKIFEMYNSGSSFAKICDALSGQKTKMNSHFTPFQIMKILKRPEYCGKKLNHDHSNMITCAYPQIVNTTIWNHAQKRLESRSKANQIRHPLSGFITCAYCKAPYYIRGSETLIHRNTKCLKKHNTEAPIKSIKLDRVIDILAIIALKYSSVGDLFNPYTKQYKEFIESIRDHVTSTLSLEETIMAKRRSAKFMESKMKQLSINSSARKEYDLVKKTLESITCDLSLREAKVLKKDRDLFRKKERAKKNLENPKNLPLFLPEQIRSGGKPFLLGLIQSEIVLCEIDSSEIVVYTKSGKVIRHNLIGNERKLKHECNIFNYWRYGNTLPSLDYLLDFTF